MDIIIENHQTKLPLNTIQAKKIIQKIIKAEGWQADQLSYNFVSRQYIQQLNKKFLGRAYATDVLAFGLKDSGQRTVNRGQRQKHPLNTVHRSPFTNKTISGDIVISVDAAMAQSKEYGTSTAYELVLYMVHGLLHLLGYDDHAPKDIQKMRRKEDQIMKYLTKLTPRLLSP